MVALPRVMTDGKTPEQWEAALAEQGVIISARKLRSTARAIGACRMLGNAMILLPEHIDQIFEEPLRCRSKPTSGEGLTGSVDGLLMATNMSDRALEHLDRISQKRPSGRSKQRPANVVSLGQTRRDRKMKSPSRLA
jgi:hypothetical protein